MKAQLICKLAQLTLGQALRAHRASALVLGVIAGPLCTLLGCRAVAAIGVVALVAGGSLDVLVGKLS